MLTPESEMPVTVTVGRLKKVYDSPEELRLVHRAKNGDEDAFQALYYTHHERVVVTITRFLDDDETAKWVANIALTKVWKALPRFKEHSKFSTWVTRIAINEARMHLRSEKRRQREVSLDSMLDRQGNGIVRPDPSANTRWLAIRDLELEGVADRQLLERAFTRVPKQYREILRLRFWEGLSEREIQEKVSAGEPELVSMSAVKSRILRGRNILMKRVEQIS
jgi:RNA polymerase sigma-70 factor (ECF subfamily)